MLNFIINQVTCLFEIFSNAINIKKMFLSIRTTSCNLDMVWTSGVTRGLESSPVSSHLLPSNKLLHVLRQQLQMLWVTLRQKAGLPLLIGEKEEGGRERERDKEIKIQKGNGGGDQKKMCIWSMVSIAFTTYSRHLLEIRIKLSPQLCCVQNLSIRPNGWNISHFAE